MDKEKMFTREHSCTGCKYFRIENIQITLYRGTNVIYKEHPVIISIPICYESQTVFIDSEIAKNPLYVDLAINKCKHYEYKDMTEEILKERMGNY